ncbi:MAG: hypothetical protein V8T85_12525 [Blautia faecicola]
MSELQDWKRDGFRGEKMIVLPTSFLPLLINFNSQNATNRMQFLSELLFRVLESNYTLGNFIYISQVLEMILSETYYREKHNATLEQVVDEFEMSKSYLNAIFQKYSQHAPWIFHLIR